MAKDIIVFIDSETAVTLTLITGEFGVESVSEVIHALTEADLKLDPEATINKYTVLAQNFDNDVKTFTIKEEVAYNEKFKYDRFLTGFVYKNHNRTGEDFTYI